MKELTVDILMYLLERIEKAKQYPYMSMDKASNGQLAEVVAFFDPDGKSLSEHGSVMSFTINVTVTAGGMSEAMAQAVICNRYVRHTAYLCWWYLLDL